MGETDSNVTLGEEFMEPRVKVKQALLAAASAIEKEGTPELLLAVDWRRVVPFRERKPYRGQRSTSGRYWSARTGGHVAHESLVERSFVVCADFDRSITWIVAQPFKLTWKQDGRQLGHIPDYLVEHEDGRRRVVSVKPTARQFVDLEQLAATEQLLAPLGFEVERWSPPSRDVMRNLEVLAAFRRPFPRLASLSEMRLSELHEPFSLGWLFRQEDPDLVACVWRGLAVGTLECDVSVPFGESTVVTPAAAK